MRILLKLLYLMCTLVLFNQIDCEDTQKISDPVVTISATVPVDKNNEAVTDSNKNDESKKKEEESKSDLKKSKIKLPSKPLPADFVDAKQEIVIFYAKKDESSNERIARKGVLTKREKAVANLIILHGYGCDKFDLSPFRLFFKKYNCLTFDFRAHGEDIEGQICTLGHDEVYDLFGAVNFIKTHKDLKDKPIIIWAPSMGASTAIEAASQDPDLCSAMFLDAPFPSTEEIIHKGMSKIKGYPGTDYLEKHAFDPYVQPVLKFLVRWTLFDTSNIELTAQPIRPVESIKKIKIPCFFVICKKDEKISVDGVKSIYLNHQGIKRLWITNGMKHCHSLFYNPEVYLKLVKDFFNDVLSKKISKQPKEIVYEDEDEQDEE